MTELQPYLQLAFKAELHCLFISDIVRTCCDFKNHFCAYRGAERFMHTCRLLQYPDDMTVGATVGKLK